MKVDGTTSKFLMFPQWPIDFLIGQSAIVCQTDRFDNPRDGLWLGLDCLHWRLNFRRSGIIVSQCSFTIYNSKMEFDSNDSTGISTVARSRAYHGAVDIRLSEVHTLARLLNIQKIQYTRTLSHIQSVDEFSFPFRLYPYSFTGWRWLSSSLSHRLSNSSGRPVLVSVSLAYTITKKSTDDNIIRRIIMFGHLVVIQHSYRADQQIGTKCAPNNIEYSITGDRL